MSGQLSASGAGRISALIGPVGRIDGVFRAGDHVLHIGHHIGANGRRRSGRSGGSRGGPGSGGGGRQGSGGRGCGNGGDLRFLSAASGEDTQGKDKGQRQCDELFHNESSCFF